MALQAAPISFSRVTMIPYVSLFIVIHYAEAVRIQFVQIHIRQRQEARLSAENARI